MNTTPADRGPAGPSARAAPAPPARKPELAGQAVVVIGGSGGIGLETAMRARAEGAEVILTGRNRDRLSQAAREVGAQKTAASNSSDRPRGRAPAG